VGPLWKAWTAIPNWTLTSQSVVNRHNYRGFDIGGDTVYVNKAFSALIALASPVEILSDYKKL
jgi:hypothetical protein